MSEHEEHEKECKHKKVRYCRACDVAFCRKCGREWGKTVWHYQYQDAVYIGRAGQPGYDWEGRPIVTSKTVTFPTPITTTTSNEHVECGSSASWTYASVLEAIGEVSNGAFDGVDAEKYVAALREEK